MLQVKNLNITIAGATRDISIVKDVSFELDAGRSLGVVGESGSGKSMTALALMGLLPGAIRASGSINLAGQELLALSEQEMCSVRGNKVAMIFQEPMTSLNPVQTIGRQVAEPLVLHKAMTRTAAREETIRLLDRVGIPDAARRLDVYPHQLSGGQRQRVMIAIALSCSPNVLVADEPTTALDVTVQRQILDLLRELVSETRMALIIISHDLGVIGEMVDEMLVMYGGSVVERGHADQVFAKPAHPYTSRLIEAIPRFGMPRSERLKTIPGTMPEMGSEMKACIFAGRCDLVYADCLEAPPPFVSVDDAHVAACIRAGRVMETTQ
ncbi:ABC transporter [Mesorhizobium sp. Root157]|uniref:ABC transporter ATP-binding protein n=1 Tax=Mesorhizobium sp. Root157 TaxID=1736477 RepID=UPI0006F442F6|nr:ABC transporter ATP-binding protein [Mesorhizobium sp. Root157]KQZ78314.1 ABC transporter [Mesorhizobium sp. Root157]